MKKLFILIIIAISVASCSTSYRVNGYETKRVSTYRKCGVRYTITDTYKREVKADTLKPTKIKVVCCQN